GCCGGAQESDCGEFSPSLALLLVLLFWFGLLFSLFASPIAALLVAAAAGEPTCDVESVVSLASTEFKSSSTRTNDETGEFFFSSACKEGEECCDATE